MDPQILNDTVFFTQIGISTFGLAALLSTYHYLHTELEEWDKGLFFLILLVASSILITVSFKEQIGADNFFVNVPGGQNPAENSFTWLYVLSLLTNVWLILALKYIRPDSKYRIGRILCKINWNWVLGIYVCFAVLSFSLTSTVSLEFRSFLDVYASAFAVLMFSACTGVVLWFRHGQGFALLMGITGVILALSQGYLFGKIYPDSNLKNYMLGSGLSPQAGISLYIIGRAGLTMCILSLSQTWLRIRMEEKNKEPKSPVQRNEFQFTQQNNDLTIAIKMANWTGFQDVSRISSKTVVKDIVRIAAATKAGTPFQHEAGTNYSRMRKQILEAINGQLPADKQLSDSDLFGKTTKETIFKFDADAVNLSEVIIRFYA